MGSEEHQYDRGYCLISCVYMPGTTMVTNASKEKPFLSLSLFLDRHIIAQLLAETGNAPGRMEIESLWAGKGEVNCKIA
ncbi:MAG: AraC family transcriptional regulator [Spirochaetaceae bacterium]|nr:AraC family transcriptional regulator [Spirochaetaceae bacterium]